MRCRECETTITVPDEAAAGRTKSSSGRPKRSAAKSSASRKKKKPQASGLSENTVWIGGGIALVLVLVIVSFFVLRGSSAEPQQAADVPPAENAVVAAVEPAAVPQAPPQPERAAAPEPVAPAIAPPPEDELLVLESITPEVLRNLMESMAEEKLQGTVAMRGRVQVHEEGRHLRSDNMIITEKVVREIGTAGEEKRSAWNFQQTQPAYQGGFVALNFAPGGDQAARYNTGNIMRTGNWVLNHPNGKPRVRGQYGNGTPALVSSDHTGLRDGIFVTWNADGRRTWQGKYVAGALEESTYYGNGEGEAIPHVAMFTGFQAVIRAMAFGGDGSTLATGDENGTVIVWNRNDQQKIASTSTGSRVVSLGFSPEGKLLAIGCQDNQLLLWQIGDNQPPQSVAVTRVPLHLKFSNDGRYLVSTAGIVEVASATSPALFTVPGTYNGWYGFIKENPQAPPTFASHFFPASAFNGERLVAATNTGIGTWNVAHDLSQSIGIEHKAKYRELMKSMFFLQGGRMIFVKKQEGYGIYDTEQNVFQPLNGPFINTQIEFSADASRAINWNSRLPTRVFDGRTFELQCVLPTDDPRVLDFYHLSPNGRYVAIGRFNNDSMTSQEERTEIPVWDLHTARRFDLKGHVAAIRTIEFSPDGRYLASSSEDLTCILWDLESHSAVKGRVAAAANQPPSLQVSIENAENLKQGDTLIASLTAEDPDGDDLAYQYRFSDDKEWWPAWQGRLEFSPLPAGQYELQVRAVDPHGAEHVMRTALTVAGSE